MANLNANQKARWAALAVVGACGLGLWTVGGALFGDDGEAQAAKELINRPWLERVPQGERDMIGHMILLEHPQGRFGATGKSSNWRHMIEVYKWRLDGDRLGLFFPQEQVRAKVQVRTWECEGEAPAPFDLCLEIKARGRSMVLYSREDWEVHPDALAESFAELAEEHEDQPELAAVLGGLEPWGEGGQQLDLLEALDLDAESWTEGALPF